MSKAKHLSMASNVIQDENSITDVTIRLEYQALEAHRLTRTFKNAKVKCPISIYLGETLNLSAESALLPFSINVESRPELFSFKVKGNMLVEGSPLIVEYWSSSKNGPPKIWRYAYRDVCKVVSELARCLELTLPKEFDQK